MNRLNTEIWTLLCLLLLTSFYPVKAAIINANSTSFIDVSNAISKASYGDTVQIPAGTSTWSNGVYVTGITLSGAGIDNTVILDNMPNLSVARMISIITVANSLSRVTGITLRGGLNPNENFKGKLECSATLAAKTSFRVDHCSFENLNGDNIFVDGANFSAVIDHDIFILGLVNAGGVTTGTGITQWGDSATDGYGDASWASPPTYGTANTLYIEDNFFTNTVPNSSSCAAYDAYTGARSVFRYNTVYNTFWADHGNDTSQRYRGTRQFEIYNNTFTDNQSFVTAMDFRSGTGVVFSNTVNGYNLFDTIENYRNVQGNYFGGVTGFNSWDSNSPISYFSGTHTGPNDSPFLQVSGSPWTVNQWAGYTVNDTNTGRFCLIQGNTTNQLIMTAPKDLGPMNFNNGDGFVIYYCYPALDQVGRGSGDLLVDVGNWPNVSTINAATGTSSWPRQILEPLYSWGNTLNGSVAGITSGYANIQEGRDIYQNAIKPGYTPLIHPHPLVSGSSTINLLPPSGLQAH